MNRLSPFFLFLALFGPGALWRVCAQDEVRGRVTAASDGHPLVGVSIFISNTSRGTVTNEKGGFTLTGIPTGRYVLVISSVGYQTDVEAIDSRNLKPFYDITLRTKVAELGEVTIRAFDKNGWKKWGELFRENFIGTTNFASHCKILNPEVIRIYYGKKSEVLSAYSEGPILIENKALGYDLQVTLNNFRYVFETGEIQYEIYPLFKEMQGTPKDEARWRKNREDAYYGSALHFMRAFYQGRVRQEGFTMQMQGIRDSVTLMRVKESLREATTPANVDSNGVRTAATNTFSKESMAEFDKIIEERAKEPKIDYPGEVPPAQIIVGQDSGVVAFYFDQYLRVTYLRKRPPGEYFNDYILDPRDPGSGRKVMVNRGGPGQGMTTTLELTKGLPVEVFSNGSFLNSNLNYDGFWGWWQKMGTLLPYDYDPGPEPTPP